MSMQRKIVERDPKKLTPHTLNAELFSDLTTDDYNNLKADIAARGIQDPLHITTDNVIISGHQRQKVALDLDIPVPCIIREDLTEDWQVEEQLIADNLLRRHLTDFQKMECGERLRHIESVKAKERQKELAGTRPNKEPDLKENLPEGNKGQTRDKVAEKIGMSGRQYDKARKVYHEAPEHIKEEWKAGKISTHNAYKQTQREQKKQQRKKTTVTPPLPDDEYDVIYADCPWRYDFSKDTSDEIEQKYPTMTQEELMELNVPAAENAVLYLWATAPKLIEALDVMRAWGFTYKTHAVWDKEWIGMGFWFRGQHELLLVGTKGKFSPPEQEKRESSVFRYKRTEHSKKPSEIRDYLARCFPDKKKIELFAREASEGWDSWGDEL